MKEAKAKNPRWNVREGRSKFGPVTLRTDQAHTVCLAGFGTAPDPTNKPAYGAKPFPYRPTRLKLYNSV
jgi:hypothetical protein